MIRIHVRDPLVGLLMRGRVLAAKTIGGIDDHQGHAVGRPSRLSCRTALREVLKRRPDRDRSGSDEEV